MPKGDYQLIIEHVYPTGLGALQQAFEELKKSYTLKDCFMKIIKTNSQTAQTNFCDHLTYWAAIKDILTTLQRRFATIPIKIILASSRQQRQTALSALLTIADQHAEPPY